MADSVALLNDHLNVTLLHSLGIKVIWEKSQLVPTQRIQFIGAMLDSLKTHVFLPHNWAEKLWLAIANLHSHRLTTALWVQQLLGHTAAGISIVPYAKSHMRCLQIDFQQHLKPNWHPQNWCIWLWSHVKLSIIWWSISSNVFLGMPFHPPPPTITLTTDASLMGWGAHTKHLTMTELWSDKDKILHISVLELKMILCQFDCFYTFWQVTRWQSVATTQWLWVT